MTGPVQQVAAALRAWQTGVDTMWQSAATAPAPTWRLPWPLGGGALDGQGDAVATGPDVSAQDATAPRQLTDLLDDVNRRQSDSTVDVRFVTGPDGRRRAIVDIPGTRQWSLKPGSDPADVDADMLAMYGQDTAYEEAVLDAMRQAGVQPTDQVMMVGHSEGGMIAVNAARDADASGEFDVTHVVTAGSPVGRIVGQVPPGVQVLTLENDRDVVPGLDGTPNPQASNITTVTGDYGDGSVADDHSITSSYEPLAAQAQASPGSAVQNFLAGAQGFLGGTQAETHTYQVGRK